MKINQSVFQTSCYLRMTRKKPRDCSSIISTRPPAPVSATLWSVSNCPALTVALISFVYRWTMQQNRIEKPSQICCSNINDAIALLSTTSSSTKTTALNIVPPLVFCDYRHIIITFISYETSDHIRLEWPQIGYWVRIDSRPIRGKSWTVSGSFCRQRDGLLKVYT